jgi:hypothetical protein
MLTMAVANKLFFPTFQPATLEWNEVIGRQNFAA